MANQQTVAPNVRKPMPKMVERKCKWCKSPFMARAADVKRGWGLFCSKPCKAMRQEKRTGQYRALQQGGAASQFDREHEDHQAGMEAAETGWDGHKDIF